ncbi:hypothetical protein AB0M92_32865 [Streptomyces sp. NPDC051582]|uniref:hypothetical protein n=1 Tax=Streptomyces sp. NPDC051582 TaxID=3155167 RepID=UPI00341BB675
MGTWREELETARGWKDYRRALRTLREAGPVFEDLPKLSRDIAKKNPGLREYSSASTFSTLLDPRLPDTRPDWLKVELVVRICLAHQGYENASTIVADWAAAYRLCGGDPGPRFPELQPDPAPAFAVEPGPGSKTEAELVFEPAPDPGPDATPESVPVSVPVPTAAEDEAGETESIEATAGETAEDAATATATARRGKHALVAAAVAGVVAIGCGLLVLQGFGDSKDSAGAPSHAGTSASATPGSQATASTPATSATGAGAGGTDIAASPGTGGNPGYATAGAAGGGSNTTPAPPTPKISPPSPKPPGMDPATDSKPGRYVSRIAWSDNGGSTVVQVYAIYADTDAGRASATGHGYDIGQDIVVLCQVPGRTVPLGNYHGPAERNGLWYRMSTGEYIPAIYVDTGKDSLPAC